MLFLSERGNICHAQFFPFFLYSHELATQLSISVRELPLERYLSGYNPYTTDVDVIGLQTWFDLAPDRMTSLIANLRKTWPHAQIIYFDWCAPLDLRYADVLAPHIAAYVKKQIFRDFRNYSIPTKGDTNLTDYYSVRYGLDLPETLFTVPSDFEKRLVLGPGFEYSPAINRLLQHPPSREHREIDLHARVAARGSEWYTRMRSEAQTNADTLGERFNVTRGGRVSYSRYIEELRNSKLCFSPFGYGEVCWRDFEAMCTGSLLLKPDVSHLRVANDIFKPYETYVPLSWDLSDLSDKVAYYVKNGDERASIARNAYVSLHEIYRTRQFLTVVRPLLELAGLTTGT